ncbi:ABC transporter permease [Actinomadura sp.]|uniref:ABC transporter permease n=1 Tax=Actinomadura sp. TaxID=1989 RepID=UPI0037CB5356
MSASTDTVRESRRQVLGDPPSSGRLRWPAKADLTIAVLALFCLWEIIARMGLVNTVFLPRASTVLVAALKLLRSSEVWSALESTAIELVVSFLISAVIGIAIGFALGWSRWLRDAFAPVVALVMSTPKSLFLPLLLVLIGVGEESKIVYGVISAIFYIATAVMGGVQGVDRKLFTAARSFGASRLDTVLSVAIPGALPAIATGLWLGLTHAFTGILIAELFVSQGGVGALILHYSSLTQTENVFALTLLLTLTAIVAGTVWNLAMNKWLSHGAEKR